MGVWDLLWWALVGLVAGGLAGTLAPSRARSGPLGVIGSGLAGALLGGWCWTLLFGNGPTSFLGAVLLGVLCALSAVALLRRSRPSHRNRPS